MPFMQMGHHHGAPMMSAAMPPHVLPRPDAATAAMMKNQNIPGMEAITRQFEKIFCYLYIKI